MEITFLFICLPCKFGALAALSWAGLLSLDLWDSSGRARSHEESCGDAAMGLVWEAWAESQVGL